MVADQVAHIAHLNARDTTLVFVSRAPQADIARLKARMGWNIPWFTITDDFDADFGVAEWHGTNVFYRDGERVFRTYFINNRGDEQMGSTWNYLDITPLGGRKSGRIRLRATRRRRPTNGGTGTTTMARMPCPTRNGSKCRMRAKRRSGNGNKSKCHERVDRIRQVLTAFEARNVGGGREIGAMVTAPNAGHQTSPGWTDPRTRHVRRADAQRALPNRLHTATAFVARSMGRAKGAAAPLSCCTRPAGRMP